MKNAAFAFTPSNMCDYLTVAHAKNHCILTKTVSQNGIIKPYDNGYLFDFYEYPVDGLSGVAAILQSLAPAWGCAIVRGAVIDPARSRDVRRLLHRDKNQDYEPTLKAVPRHWLAIDVDDLPLPPEVHPADLPRCARIAITILPPEFQGVRVIVQATGSHGIKPGARLRLWYWLHRLVDNAELKNWLRHPQVDTAVFNSCQLIYTATPLFESRTDHLPYRMHEIPGAEAVQVPTLEISKIKKKKLTDVSPVLAAPFSSECVQATLVDGARRILDAVEGSRHKTLIAVSLSLLPLLRAGAVTEEAAREVIVRATQRAGWSDPDKINNVITWAFRRQSYMPTGENADV